jgi:hypothetical protein
VTIKVLRRIAILLVELLAEALLLGLYLGILIVIQGEPRNAALGAIIALPVILALYGYYIPRIFVTLGWLSRSRWPYILLSSAAFIVHSSYMSFRMWPDITPAARAETVPFIIGGTCVVFACSFAGEHLRRSTG